MSNKTKIANRNDLPAGKAMAVTVNNRKIAVFNVGGNLYAIDDECTHAGGNLSEGEVKDHAVSCPWHGARFDLTNGSVLSAPACESVGSYKVYFEAEDILVETP